MSMGEFRSDGAGQVHQVVVLDTIAVMASLAGEASGKATASGTAHGTKSSGSGHAKVSAKRWMQGHAPANPPSKSGWRLVWGLLGYCVPRKTREKIYTPAHNDLLLDFLETRQYCTKWSRRWLQFCFTFQTVVLMLACWRELTTSGVLNLIPERLRRLLG